MYVTLLKEAKCIYVIRQANCACALRMHLAHAQLITMDEVKQTAFRLRLFEIPIYMLAQASMYMGWGAPTITKRPSVLSRPSGGY